MMHYGTETAKQEMVGFFETVDQATRRIQLSKNLNSR